MMLETAGEAVTSVSGHGGRSNGKSLGPSPFPYRRQPWKALALSLLMPGLGHVYCGLIGRGLIFMFISGMMIPTALIALARCATAGTSSLVPALLPLPLVWIAAAADAFRMAFRTRPDYGLKDYNRTYIYLLLLLIGTGSCLAYAFHVRDEYLEAFQIPSDSSFPTILRGDRLLANKLAYIAHDPQRGDLIVFRMPDRPQGFAQKRIVALAGDTVEMRDGQLYINGEACARQDLGQRTLRSEGRDVPGRIYSETNGSATYRIFVSDAPADSVPQNTPAIKVPPYHCFVLGDNRNASHDSRHFGPVAITGIVGRIDYLYWPAETWSRFGRLASSASRD